MKNDALLKYVLPILGVDIGPPDEIWILAITQVLVDIFFTERFQATFFNLFFQFFTDLYIVYKVKIQ